MHAIEPHHSASISRRGRGGVVPKAVHAVGRRMWARSGGNARGGLVRRVAGRSSLPGYDVGDDWGVREGPGDLAQPRHHGLQVRPATTQACRSRIAQVLCRGRARVRLPVAFAFRGALVQRDRELSRLDGRREVLPLQALLDPELARLAGDCRPQVAAQLEPDVEDLDHPTVAAARHVDR